MNRPTYYKFKLSRVACPAPFYLHRFHFPLQHHSLLFTFSVKQWFTEIAWWPFYLKTGGRVEKLRGWKNAEKVISVPDTWVAFLNWWDVLRNKVRFYTPQTGEATVGDELVMVCLSLICSTCWVLHNSRWLSDTSGLNKSIFLSHCENVYNHLYTIAALLAMYAQKEWASSQQAITHRKRISLSVFIIIASWETISSPVNTKSTSRKRNVD